MTALPGMPSQCASASVEWLRAQEQRAEDLVLREEARRSGGTPVIASVADQHQDPRDRHVLPEAAHVAHVLRVVVVVRADARVHRVDDRAGAEEEQALKKACVKTWKKPAENAPDADAEEHEAELAHGGVGEHLLDVVLREADRRREERRERADDGDRRSAPPATARTARAGGDEVDARGDHRGRVDERGDRRRAGHRVGQPDVERDLRALAGAAEEEEEADRRDHQRRRTASLRRRGAHAARSRACPMLANSRNIATRRPKSPMRLTMNAFLPASAFALSVNQKPMSR